MDRLPSRAPGCVVGRSQDWAGRECGQGRARVDAFDDFATDIIEQLITRETRFFVIP